MIIINTTIKNVDVKRETKKENYFPTLILVTNLTGIVKIIKTMQLQQFSVIGEYRPASLPSHFTNCNYERLSLTMSKR